jgi:hypothetical protein
VKSGADMDVILNSNVNEVRNLAKDDILIIWGGVKDVCRNETHKCIKQVSKFVQSNLNMNVIFLNLPKRRDLVEQSCVNKEIDTCNRKLGKHLKVIDRVHYVVINYDRKYHTSHSMHLNVEGKEYVAKQLVSFIIMKLNKDELAVISLDWDYVKMNDNTEKSDNCKSDVRCKYDEGQETLSEDLSKLKEQHISPVLGKRVRRRPVNRHDDFLW